MAKGGEIFIYKTTNNINGMIYVGQCARKRGSKKYIGSGVLFKRAVKKYGRENFSREILEDNIENLDVLNKREEYWVDFYDSTSPLIGYNISKGGYGVKGLSGEKNPNFGKHPSLETREKMRKSRPDQSGEKNPNFGKITPPEVIEKIKKSTIGKKRSEKNKEGISKSNLGKKRSNASSKYKGVYFDKHQKRWQVSITIMKKQTFIGYYETEIEAALAYNQKILELNLSKDRLNIIDENEINKTYKYYPKGKRRNSISKYIGVSRKNGRWYALIEKNEKTYYLGYFDTEEDAALAWNKKAIELGLPPDRLNRIE